MSGRDSPDRRGREGRLERVVNHAKQDMLMQRIGPKPNGRCRGVRQERRRAPEEIIMEIRSLSNAGFDPAGIWHAKSESDVSYELGKLIDELRKETRTKDLRAQVEYLKTEGQGMIAQFIHEAETFLGK